MQKPNFLRVAIQEPIFFVDRKQTTAVTMGMVLAIAQKFAYLSNPAIRDPQPGSEKMAM
jgi:hypothetical protein